jgi:hypothetical protein
MTSRLGTVKSVTFFYSVPTLNLEEGWAARDSVQPCCGHTVVPAPLLLAHHFPQPSSMFIVLQCTYPEP